MLNSNLIRNDFKILQDKVNDNSLIYLDSAATSLTPNCVVEAIGEYYYHNNANYSRGVSTLSNNLTLKIEETRTKIAKYFGFKDSKNIVFTKNSTESINILANGLINVLKPGDEIVLSEQEHHANILPWINLANQSGAVLKYIPIDELGNLKVEEIPNIVTPKTKVFSLNQVSSTLGYLNDIESITKTVKEISNCFIVIDGAQSAGHVKTNFENVNIDAFIFSAHKMLGPTGLGVLYISDHMANFVEPLLFGGQMVDVATKDEFKYKGLPFKYEAGTLNLAAIFGFSKSIDYINELGIENIESHIKDLTLYFYEQSKNIKNIKWFNDLTKSHGIVSFNIAKAHSHESSSDLDKFGIQTRAGSHCSQIYFANQSQDNNVRISFYVYNTKEEIDITINKIKTISKKWQDSLNDDFSQEEILKQLKMLKQSRGK